MTKLKMLIIGSVLCAGVTCFSQTTNNATAQPEQIVVTNASQSLAAFCHFKNIGGALSAIMVLVIPLWIKALASYWRNFAQNNKTAGEVTAVGRAIAHIAADSLPLTPDTPERAPTTPPGNVA